MMLDIRIHDDVKSWSTVLERYSNYDFGHTYDFHLISQNNGEGDPLLYEIVGANNESIMCWPTLKRKIPDSSYIDLTSVYGYSGPLINNSELLDVASSLIFNTMLDSGVVSLFSRMHPLLLRESSVLRLDGTKIGNIVVIDTDEQNETIKTYRSNHRRDIRKARRAGVNTIVDSSCDQIDEFVRIYHATMQDLKARDYYFFDSDYFLKFSTAANFNAELIFSRYENKNIGAILLVTTNNIMHYYLGGVDREFLHLSPLKLMLERAHQMAIDNGIRYLVLGGGPHGLDDSLIQFKKGFSQLIYPFFVLKKILNFDTYKNICSENHVDYNYTDFFPAYRRHEY